MAFWSVTWLAICGVGDADERFRHHQKVEVREGQSLDRSLNHSRELPFVLLYVLRRVATSSLNRHLK